MLALVDCIALSDLAEEEIDAIAEHEHVPEIAAVELGAYLIHRPGGSMAIRRMIIDDIVEARLHERYVHSAKLQLVLQAFVARYRASVAGANESTNV